MHVLALSIGRSILKAGSRERLRMHTYARHLDELHIVVLTRKEHGYSEIVHEGNVHIYPTNSATRAMMLYDAFRISREVILGNKKVVYTVTAQDPFEIGLLGLILARDTGARLHVQIHGDYFSSSHWRGRSVARRLRLQLARFVLARASGIRVVSKRIKTSLLACGMNEARVTVLPIRPELETFLAAPHTVGNHTPFVFLIASRFAPEKNIPLMIRSFGRVATTHGNLVLRIVGQGEEEIKIKKCIADLRLEHTVTLIPWTEHLEKEMQTADVFLSASYHEAYGLTLVEALAVGLPLITTDVGCVGEVVQNEVHGIVVPVGDEDAFVQGMQRMITDEAFRKNCSEAGRSTAQELSKTSDVEYAKAWVAALSR